LTQLSTEDRVAELTKLKMPGASQREPGKLKRRLRGDLDNIVLKALRKEPARRYASAEQFAEDIRRHLQGLPVTATPDSVPYRASKFVRRHKAGAAATVLVALAIIGGVATTLREARIAVHERARAERRFNDVRKLANSFLFEFDDAIKNLPGSTPARSLVVKRALEYLDGMAAEARGDRSLQMEIATAYLKVGEVQGDPSFPNLGDSKGALESTNKALSILETLSRSDPKNTQVRMALADAHQEISDVLDFSGDTGGAVAHSKSALEIYDGLAGSLAGNREFQQQRLVQTYHYANLLRYAGRLDEAAAEYEQAIELSRQMIAAYPSEKDGKIHLATSLDGLGNVLQEKGETAGALENRGRGLTIREELTRLDPNDAHYRRQLAFSHHNLGLSLVEAGDLKSALAHFRTELGLFETLSAADPKDVQGRRNCSLAHKQIGDVLMRSEDIHAALDQYRKALEIDRGLTVLDPGNFQAALDLSFSETKAGAALVKLGQMQEGLAILRSGVARQETLLGTDSHHVLMYSHLANSYILLASSLLARDRERAIGYYRKAVAARLTYATKSPNSSMNRGALADCYANLAKALAPADHKEALKEYANAIDLLEQVTASDPSNARYRTSLAEALSNTARLYVSAAEESADASSRIEYWTKARSFYLRSKQSWQALESSKVSPAHLAAIEEVNTEIVRCDNSLAKLQPAQ
jgi:tetratricopeptide (TPR) repeat protein